MISHFSILYSTASLVHFMLQCESHNLWSSTGILISQDISLVHLFKPFKGRSELESARVLPELVEGVDPFVEDPLGALEHGAAAVHRLHVPVAGLVQPEPDRGRPLPRPDGDLLAGHEEGGGAAALDVVEVAHEGGQDVAGVDQVAAGGREDGALDVAVRVHVGLAEAGQPVVGHLRRKQKLMAFSNEYDFFERQAAGISNLIKYFLQVISYHL